MKAIFFLSLLVLAISATFPIFTVVDPGIKHDLTACYADPQKKFAFYIYGQREDFEEKIDFDIKLVEPEGYVANCYIDIEEGHNYIGCLVDIEQYPLNSKIVLPTEVNFEEYGFNVEQWTEIVGAANTIEEQIPCVPPTPVGDHTFQPADEDPTFFCHEKKYNCWQIEGEFDGEAQMLRALSDTEQIDFDLPVTVAGKQEKASCSIFFNTEEPENKRRLSDTDLDTMSCCVLTSGLLHTDEQETVIKGEVPEKLTVYKLKKDYTLNPCSKTDASSYLKVGFLVLLAFLL